MNTPIHVKRTKATPKKTAEATLRPRRPGDSLTLLRSGEVISQVVAALEQAYAALRRRWPDLPAVVITVFYDRHRSVRGYFWDGQWRSQADPFLPELHIDSTILNDPPAAILRTLVHEAVHALARARGIQETSREGRYHNHRFAELAREMGLQVEPDRQIGFRTPAVQLAWLAGGYAPLVDIIASASRRLWQEGMVVGRTGGNGTAGTGTTTANGPKGRLVKAICRCQPPRIIRGARNTLSAAPIRCTACGSDFSTEP